MSKRTYPYTAWALQPSFKPVEVELVRASGDWDLNVKGKYFSTEHDLFPSKTAAIAAGRARIKDQKADIAKRQERLDKRIAALDKAEREA